MNPFEMVVMIVFIGSVASVLRAKYRVGKDWKGNDVSLDDPDSDRMRGEIKGLKERIAVLERVVTDTNSAAALDREIDKLR
jgi:hypothetical protein